METNRYFPRYPGFPVEVGGVVDLHAAFLEESRTRGSVWCCVTGNPGTLGRGPPSASLRSRLGQRPVRNAARSLRNRKQKDFERSHSKCKNHSGFPIAVQHRVHLGNPVVWELCGALGPAYCAKLSPRIKTNGEVLRPEPFVRSPSASAAPPRSSYELPGSARACL